MKARLKFLAVIHFPIAPKDLSPSERLDLAIALRQLDLDVAGSTIIIPHQEWRSQMKISFDVFAPGNVKAMGFALEYNGLPPEHLMEVAALSRSFAEYIRNKSGTAAGNAEKYRVTFNYDARQNFALPDQLKMCFKNDAVQDELKFSETAEIINAGIKLLADLQLGAAREIASGQKA